MSITLIIPGGPTGKGRPRTTKQGRMYTPKATVDAEGNVRSAWHAAGEPRIEGKVPVRLLVVAVLRRPGGHWKVSGDLSAAGEREPYPIGRVDSDNVLKLQMDALNGAAYQDDGQVIDARVVKRWAAPMESAHTRIELSEVEVAA